MAKLKEQEAIEYLDRASSCIHPEDPINQLQLIKAMLDIESAYIGSLVGTDLEDMARISLDATGFPELKSWLVDINEAFRQYDKFRVRLAGQMAPLVSSVLDLDKTAISKQSREVAAFLPGFSSLAKVFPPLTYDQRQVLKNEKAIANVLYMRKALPGLLLGRETGNCFQHIYGTWKVLRNVSEIAGFKYLDSKSMPMILRIPINAYIHYEYMQVSTPANSIVSKAKTECEDGCDRGSGCQSPLIYVTKYKDVLGDDEKILVDLETSFHALHPGFKKAFISTDLTGLSDQERLAFKDAIWQLDGAAKRITTIYQDVLNGVPVSPEKFIEENRLFAEKTDILDSVPGEYLRRALQTGNGEPLSEVGSLIQSLVKPQIEEPSSAGRLETTKAVEVRKKRFWLF
ncbi:hypothetical protein HYW46_01765 [Candidatus Daviesbacteria bacterium]|nr:hypothetical protein [Candidatus Daviesbacteria bacterium]